MRNMPKISVVLAVYNGERDIRPSVESVLAQTYKDFEFIIVNDASTDATLSVLSSYKDPRLIICNNDKNIGQTSSLNAGLRIARGEYIARIDSGDISVPERFLNQVHYLDKHPDVDILGTAAFQYDVAGNFRGNVYMSNRPKTILQRIIFSCPVIHISVMMRRVRVLQLGGYNESYRILADYGLWAKALQNGCIFSNLGAVLAGYVVNPDSFGYSHGRGRSVQEAAKIIQETAKNMTGMELCLDQTEHLYRFFVFGPQEMDSEWMLKTEFLYETLMRKLHIPSRDIDYQLVKYYLKALNGKQHLPSAQNNMPKYIMSRICSRLGGCTSSLLFEDLIQSMFFTRRKSFCTKDALRIYKRLMNTNNSP